MESITVRLKNLLHDPFGKEKVKKHEKVIRNIEVTTELTRSTTKKVKASYNASPFPVGHMIGHRSPEPVVERYRAAPKRSRRTGHVQ